MKDRLLLYVGIVFLAGGIVTKSLTDSPIMAWLLIAAGVASKVSYVFLKIKSGEYKPGFEVFFLLVGLLLFFSGLHLRSDGFNAFNPACIITTGITFKLTFIILFIIKIKQKSHV